MRTVTHLFNAMRPFLHRDPGIVGAALARDDVVVQLIVDGVHLAPETAIVTWRAAPGRVALVTDSITAAGETGESDGEYSLGSLDVQVHEGAVRGPDGVLAGSVLTMIEAVRNLHALGVPLADAVGAATAVPARVLGLPELGRLDVGLPADIVILDDNVEIERVLVAGDVHVAGQIHRHCSGATSFGEGRATRATTPPSTLPTSVRLPAATHLKDRDRPLGRVAVTVERERAEKTVFTRVRKSSSRTERVCRPSVRARRAGRPSPARRRPRSARPRRRAGSDGIARRSAHRRAETRS